MLELECFGIALIGLLIYIFANSKEGFIALRSNMRGQKIKIWDSKNGWIVKNTEYLGDDVALKIYTDTYTIFYKPIGKSGIDDFPALVGALPASKYIDIYDTSSIYIEIIDLGVAQRENEEFKQQCLKHESEKTCFEKFLL